MDINKSMDIIVRPFSTEDASSASLSTESYGTQHEQLKNLKVELKGPKSLEYELRSFATFSKLNVELGMSSPRQKSSSRCSSPSRSTRSPASGRHSKNVDYVRKRSSNRKAAAKESLSDPSLRKLKLPVTTFLRTSPVGQPTGHENFDLALALGGVFAHLEGVQTMSSAIQTDLDDKPKAVAGFCMNMKQEGTKTTCNINTEFGSSFESLP